MELEVLWVIGGLLLVGIGLADAFRTTLWPEGRAARVSSLLARGVWNGLGAIANGSRHRLLSLAGPAILVLTVFVWVATVAAGWTLVMTPEEALRSTREEPVDVAGRIWYVVYTMHTVGNGDYTPTTDWSEIASSFTAFTGMVVITLAVTYLLSIVNAVARRRALASSVAALGSRPETVVVEAWDGRAFPGLSTVLDSLSSSLADVQHQRRAFPMARYFHPTERSQSSEAMIPVLDDALTLLACGVAPEHRPAPGPVSSARSSVASYLGVLENEPVEPAAEPPPAPNLGALRDAGIPTVSDAAFSAEMAALADRRRLLRGLLEGDHWEWDPA